MPMDRYRAFQAIGLKRQTSERYCNQVRHYIDNQTDISTDRRIWTGPCSELIPKAGFPGNSGSWTSATGILPRSISAGSGKTASYALVKEHSGFIARGSLAVSAFLSTIRSLLQEQVMAMRRYQGPRCGKPGYRKPGRGPALPGPAIA